MSDEKPLHVRVAEALGCKPEQATPGPRSWRCTCPKDPKALNFLPHGLADMTYLRNYDTDWSATGPLIEKYGITLTWIGDGHGITRWEASDNIPEQSVYLETGPTPLVAVCRFLLALKAAGKLEPPA